LWPPAEPVAFPSLQYERRGGALLQRAEHRAPNGQPVHHQHRRGTYRLGLDTQRHGRRLN